MAVALIVLIAPFSAFAEEGQLSDFEEYEELIELYEEIDSVFPWADYKKIESFDEFVENKYGSSEINTELSYTLTEVVEGGDIYILDVFGDGSPALISLSTKGGTLLTGKSDLESTSAIIRFRWYNASEYVRVRYSAPVLSSSYYHFDTPSLLTMTYCSLYSLGFGNSSQTETVFKGTILTLDTTLNDYVEVMKLKLQATIDSSGNITVTHSYPASF